MGDDIAADVWRPISPPWSRSLVACRPAAERGGEVNELNHPRAIISGRLPNNGAPAPGRKSPWERFYLLE
jgi:hypothetical protein